MAPRDEVSGADPPDQQLDSNRNSDIDTDDNQNIDAALTPAAEEPNTPSPEDNPSPLADDTDAAPPRATGGFRGRAGGKRGGFRGRRGGAKAKSKPAPKPTAGITKGRGGRRGGRRKASVNPRIDALNARAAELKFQYSAIVKFQKHALETLADKSLTLVKGIPTYHEELPEFGKVTQRLQDTLEARYAQIDRVQEMEIEQQRFLLKVNNDLAEQQYGDRCDDAMEAALAYVQEHSLYVWHQAQQQKPLSEFPNTFEKDGNTDLDIPIIDVPKLVHQSATPFTKQKPAIPSENTEGDTPYEQHVANYYASLDPKQRKEVAAERRSQWRKRERRAAGVTEAAPTNKRKRQALFQPQQAHAAVYGDDDEAEEGDDDAARNSAENTPGAGQNDAAKVSLPATSSTSTSTDESSDNSDVEEYAEDEYGVYCPRKKARANAHVDPNNRVRLSAWCKFDDDEIGVRETHFKWYNPPDKGGVKQLPKMRHLGMDASPNPAHFYVHQKGNMINSMTMSEEDFDPVMIKTHGLHPKFGFPLPDSKNPDFGEEKEQYFKPTDWNTLQEASLVPKRVVHRYADGTTKLFSYSRGWRDLTAKRWEEHGPKVAMMRLLQATEDDELRLIPDVDPAAIRVHDYFLQAANDAAEEQEREEKQRKLNPAPAVSVSAARYDPVRDVYRTPYPPPTPAPPPPQALYQQGGPLTALADMATMPPPPPFHPGPPPPPPQQQLSFIPGPPPPPAPPQPRRVTWVEPTPLPTQLPPQMAQMAGMSQYMIHPSAPPPFQGQGPSQGNLRPLQPAPPRGGRRMTPPLPLGPRRRGDGGHGGNSGSFYQ